MHTPSALCPCFMYLLLGLYLVIVLNPHFSLVCSPQSHSGICVIRVVWTILTKMEWIDRWCDDQNTTDLKYFCPFQAFNVMEAEELERMDLGVYKIIHEGAQPDDSLEDVGIIIERCTVLQDLHDVASGCALLFGLIYCLNLSYPKPLRYTFEFFQKVLMGLEDKKLSNKIQVLKNKLCQKETQWLF